jgi:peptide deformylase
MAVKNIVHYGHPILRKKCDSLKDFSNIDPLLDDMFDSMYEAEGIGLAANQIGLDMNLFIIDVTHTEETETPHVFINSKIISKYGDEGVYQEGCLSLPGISLDVLRPEKVTLKYQTPDEGLLSRAIQHETDHLNGIYIIDRVSEIEKIQYQTELKEIEKISKKRHKVKSGKKGFVL